MDYYKIVRNSIMKTFVGPFMVATILNMVAEIIAVFYTFFIGEIIKFILDKEAPYTKGIWLVVIFAVATICS